MDDTLIVFTSDHGEELLDHGAWSHGRDFYDHQLHVPFIVRNPGGAHGGIRSESIVELVDLMPTLLAIGRAEIPAGVQGRDISGLFRALPVDELDITFATASTRYPNQYSARTLRHKLVYDVDEGTSTLFDLKYDPREQHGIRKPDENDRLRDEIVHHIAETTAEGKLDRESAEIPDALKERLEALGYLN
jgi:arylsulfatase A-like enzyme